MPIPIHSEFRPTNGLSFALLEDKYFRGGFRVVVTEQEMLNLHYSARKEFMWVIVSDQRRGYMLLENLTDWVHIFDLSVDNKISFTAAADSQNIDGLEDAFRVFGNSLLDSSGEGSLTELQKLSFD